jgi:hypothetical protein
MDSSLQKENECSKLLDYTKNMYEELSDNKNIYEGLSTTESIKKRKLYHIEPSCIFRFFVCPLCDFTEDINKITSTCSYCDLLNELAEESRKILKLKTIVNFLKKIDIQKRSKENIEFLIKNVVNFIFIAKKNIIYPAHISNLFSDILNNNFISFYEYFKNTDLRKESNYFLPNNLNYYFIFLNTIIIYYFKRGWGWDKTFFPKDKTKLILYVENRIKELKKEFDEKVKLMEYQIYRLENWIFN